MILTLFLYSVTVCGEIKTDEREMIEAICHIRDINLLQVMFQLMLCIRKGYIT